MEPASHEPKRKPIIARRIGQTFMLLIVLGASVVAFARMRAVPIRIIEPPSYLLPGNRPPTNAACDSLHDGRFRCYVIQGGKEVYLAYNGASQMIISAVISAREYTIGDLITAWGTPAGFTQDGRAIEVNWGTHSAYLHTCSFQAFSRVGYIEYSLEPKQGSPWRGFTNRADRC